MPTDAAGDETQTEAGPIKLSDAQWAEIQDKYELGTHSLSELSAEYGTTKSNISQYLRRRNVQKGSRQHEILQAQKQKEENERKAKTAAAAAAAAHVGPGLAARVEKFIDLRMDRIEDTRDTYYKLNDLVTKITAKKLQDQVKSHLPIAALEDEFKALRRATDIFAISRRERWELLNVDGILDQDEGLPELVVRELFEDEINKLRDADDGDEFEVDIDLNLDPLSGEKIENPDDIIDETT